MSAEIIVNSYSWWYGGCHSQLCHMHIVLLNLYDIKIRLLATPEKCMYFSESITTEPKVTNPWELWKEIYLSFLSHPGLKAGAKTSRNIWKAQKSNKQTNLLKSGKRRLQKHIEPPLTRQDIPSPLLQLLPHMPPSAARHLQHWRAVC